MASYVGLARYDLVLGPLLLGFIWTLNKRGLVLAVSIVTHRLGWELGLLSSGILLRSRVCTTCADVLGTADAWRTEATAKGWT